MTADFEDAPAVERTERPLLFFWVLAGVSALCFYVLTYAQVHLEAAIDFKIDRKAAVAQSRVFLEQQGYDLAGYRHAVAFYTQDTTLKFVQKEANPNEAEQMLRDEIPAWYWFVRWFVPSREEEFSVAFRPDGRLLFFNHHLPEDAPGASPDAGQARLIAEAFLKGSAGIDVSAGYAPMATKDEKLPNRSRYTFTWERQGFNLAGATHRVYATVEGDTIAHYAQGLHIPENWSGEEARKESQRRALRNAGKVLESLFKAALFILLVIKLRARALRPRFAICISLVALLLLLAVHFNSIPARWMGYDTRDSISAFYGDILEKGLMTVLGALGCFLLVLVAESLGRDAFPHHVSLSRMTSWRYWQSRPVFVAVAVGLCLSLCHAAYYGAFYLLAGKVGAWCPLEPPPVNAIAMPLPWLSPLESGFFAAFDEELLFRLFAISLLLRLTGRRWLAVTIPAVAWALLHSMYPQEPIYIRALELLPVGIIFGYVFVRYGILATFVSHYTYNALASSEFMIRSGILHIAVPSAIAAGAMVLLLLPGIIYFLHNRKFADVTEPVEAGKDAGPPPEPEPLQETPVTPPYLPAERYSWKTATMLGALGIVLFTLTELFPVEGKFGDAYRMCINRWQALQTADEFLRSRNVPVSNYRRVVSFENHMGGDDADYLYEKGGLETLNGVFRTYPLPTVRASVRYFIPKQIEQWRVIVGPDGIVDTYTHYMEEVAPGARLTKEEAQTMAAQAMAERGIDLADFDVVDSSTKEYASRTDHWFEWEHRKKVIEDATFRISMSVKGNEPQSFAAYIKVPEQWSRAREEHTLKDAIERALLTVISISSIILLIRYLYLLFTLSLLAFRPAFLLASLAFLCAIIEEANSLCVFWEDYASSSSALAYMFTHATEAFFFVPLAKASGFFILMIVAEGSWRHCFFQQRPIGYWFGLRRFYGESDHISDVDSTSAAWPHAILLGLFCVGAFSVLYAFDCGSNRLVQMFVEMPHYSAPDSAAIGGRDVYVPAIDVFLKSLTGMLHAGMAALLLGSFYRAWLDRHPLRLAAFTAILLSVAVAASSYTVTEAAKNAIGIPFVAMELLIGFVLVRRVFRYNVAAYFMGAFFISVVPATVTLLRTPEPYAFWNGVVLFALVGGLVLFAVIACSRAGGAVRVPVQEPGDEGEAAAG